jgi:hypothetical protein
MANKRQRKKAARSAANKTESAIRVETLNSSTGYRFNVLRSLSPSNLVRYIESFESGDFYWLARTMAAMENRDDSWKVAAAKTRKDVSRRRWQCVPLEGCEEDEQAAAQAEKLQAFYNRLQVVDWKCRNVRKGVRGLISGVARSYNDWFSVSELVFDTSGGELSAVAMNCPLEWFVLRNGLMHLRGQLDGTGDIPLEDGGWIIAEGDGVGVACSVAYQFKRMAVGDWAIYSGRCGHPGVQGKTDAEYGSTQWSNMKAAVQAFTKEWATVTGLNDVFEKIDLSISGELPFPKMVETMSRSISALQRGADLSTMSAGSGSGEGASLQGEESDILLGDNCEMVSETLRAQLDPVVIAWYFGEDAKIKAGFELIPPESDTIDADLKIDQALINMGVKLSKADALSRYNRREADTADPDDEPLRQPQTAPAMPGTPFANEKQPGSAVPADGTDTPAGRGGSNGNDPAAEIINRAAAAILDGSKPFKEAMSYAMAELEKLPGAADRLPDTLEDTLTDAMFKAASDNIQETA